MKILFLGDYSGYHHTLAQQLRRMGHECVVASNGSRCMDTRRDIDIKREPGALNSLSYLYRMWRLMPELKGYDVVQLVNPGFLSLRPGKLRYFFDRIKRQNGAIGLTLCGSDSFVVSDSLSGSLFRYSEYNVGAAPSEYALKNSARIAEWTSPSLTDYCRYIYDNVDCAVSALYEYHTVGKRHLGDKPLSYAGIPVDTESIGFEGLSDDDKIRILVGIKSEFTDFKGTGRLLTAAKEVESRLPDLCKVEVARDMPLSEYLERLSRADVVVDQLYSYTPATNALQAMAMGKITVSGAEPEFYDFIGERELKPVINAEPDDAKLIEMFERLVKTPRRRLEEISRDGRLFVEKHNSSPVVAQRFVEAWEKVIR